MLGLCRDRSNIGLTNVGPVHASSFGQARFIRENLRRKFSTLHSSTDKCEKKGS